MTQEHNFDKGLSPLTPVSGEGAARETGHVNRGTRVADESYFASRSLKSGSAGWFLLMGLGVAYVISGDFSGWNYGIRLRRMAGTAHCVYRDGAHVRLHRIWIGRVVKCHADRWGRIWFCAPSDGKVWRLHDRFCCSY